MYYAANKGLAAFSGDAVGLLNADDRFADASALSWIAEGLDGADIVFGNLDFVADHETGRVVRRWRGTPYERGAISRGWMPAHPTFYVDAASRRRLVNLMCVTRSRPTMTSCFGPWN